MSTKYIDFENVNFIKIVSGYSYYSSEYDFKIIDEHIIEAVRKCKNPECITVQTDYIFKSGIEFINMKDKYIKY